jgi:hypothetical protein
MDYDIPSDFVDFVVSRFFCSELEATKIKMYYFDGTVKTSVITREMLEEICLNCDYRSSSDEEESQEETEEHDSEEDPKN